MRAGFRRKASELGLVYFWTFTLPGKGSTVRGDPRRSRAELPRLWNVLRTALRRRLGRFSYIAVPEPQRDGTAHLHVVLNRYIPKAELDAVWAENGGGFTWVEKADVQRAGAYLSKYLAKTWDRDAPWDERYLVEIGGIPTLKYRPWRRWWESLDDERVLQPRDPESGWTVVYASPFEWAEIMEATDRPPPMDAMKGIPS